MLPLAILLSDPEWLPPAKRILVGATSNSQATLLETNVESTCQGHAENLLSSGCVCPLTEGGGLSVLVNAAMRSCSAMCWSLRAWQYSSRQCPKGVSYMTGVTASSAWQCFSSLSSPASGAGASAPGSQGSSPTHGCFAGGGCGAEGGLQGQVGGLCGAGHQDRGRNRGHPPAQAAAGEDLLLSACATAVPSSSSHGQQAISWKACLVSGLGAGLAFAGHSMVYAPSRL